MKCVYKYSFRHKNNIIDSDGQITRSMQHRHSTSIVKIKWLVEVYLPLSTSSRLLSKHFCLNLFFPKDLVCFTVCCLVQWLHGWVPLCWNFRVLSGVLKKSLIERYMQLSFLPFSYKYLNLRVRRIGEHNGKFFQKQTNKKT